MFKLKHHFHPTDAVAHFEKLIARSPGNCRWFGTGIGFLSLTGEVTMDAFRTLTANRHPAHGKILVASHRGEDGRPTPLFIEIVITLTPSVAFLVDRSLDICSAHWHAATAALRYLEVFAGGPTERDGLPCGLISSNFVGISFECFTTFAGTPMPQIRFLLFPLTYDEEEEEWLALYTDEIADECECAAELYLSELCPDWQDHGLEVTENTPGAPRLDTPSNLN